jgi:hypothetical protein
VCPRVGLDAVVKRRIPSPCWDSNPPIIQPVAQCCTTELSWFLTKYYGDYIKNDRMDVTCTIHGVDGKDIYIKFWSESQKGKDHLVVLRADERITLNIS